MTETLDTTGINITVRDGEVSGEVDWIMIAIVVAVLLLLFII